MLWLWLIFGLISVILYSVKIGRNWNAILAALLAISGPIGLVVQSVYWITQ